MTNLPILFSPDMVRAILAGRKTQTRRVIRPQPHPVAKGCYLRPDGSWVWLDAHRENNGVGYCGNRLDNRHFYTQHNSGDRLYVREAWRTTAIYDAMPPRNMDDSFPVRYEADKAWVHHGLTDTNAGRFRQGMHMPKWASRITLHVSDVRVERVQDISDRDALAEGVEIHKNMEGWSDGDLYSSPAWPVWGPGDCWDNPVGAFRNLWDSLNASRGFGWDVNPWVTATTFEPEFCNISEARK